MIALLPSANRNSSATLVVPVNLHVEEWTQAVFVLDVTAAATLAGDTLDVFLQGSPDPSGPYWNDFVHFTQVLGNGGAKRFEARWTSLVAPTTAQAAPQDGALAAGVAQGLFGAAMRVKWVLVGTGNFTFAVNAVPQRVV